MKSKRAPKLIQWINTGIFQANVMFIHDFEYDEVMAHLKKKKADNWYLGLSKSKELIDGGSYFGIRRTIGNPNKKDMDLFYIWIKKPFRFTDYDYCVLAHEVLHICQFLLSDILNRDKEIEAEAYLHTHIMSQCLKHLRS